MAPESSLIFELKLQVLIENGYNNLFQGSKISPITKEIDISVLSIKKIKELSTSPQHRSDTLKGLTLICTLAAPLIGSTSHYSA